jgi:hypothetical protein
MADGGEWRARTVSPAGEQGEQCFFAFKGSLGWAFWHGASKPRWSYLQQKSYPPNGGSAGCRGNRLNSSAMRARSRDSLRQQINPLAMTYGYERLRFPKPVFIGDTIRTKVTIAEKRDHKRPDCGIVVEKLEVLNQRDECVMACEHLLLVKR